MKGYITIRSGPVRSLTAGGATVGMIAAAGLSLFIKVILAEGAASVRVMGTAIRPARARDIFRRAVSIAQKETRHHDGHAPVRRGRRGGIFSVSSFGG